MTINNKVSSETQCAEYLFQNPLAHSRWRGVLDGRLRGHDGENGGWTEIMNRYAVVIEAAQGNYSGYVPDLPGCVATGATIDDVETHLRIAIRFHLDGLIEDGLPVPEALAVAEYLEA